VFDPGRDDGAEQLEYVLLVDRLPLGPPLALHHLERPIRVLDDQVAAEVVEPLEDAL
jgi:hypothetical protein